MRSVVYPHFARRRQHSMNPMSDTNYEPMGSELSRKYDGKFEWSANFRRSDSIGRGLF